MSTTSKGPHANGSAKPSYAMELPPKLSPTLPPWVDEMMLNIPQRMLSPTLPPVFDNIEESGTSAAKRKEHTPTPPLHHPVPRRAGKHQFSKVIGDDLDSPSPPIGAAAASLPAKPQPRRANSYMVSIRLSPEFHKRFTSSGKEKGPVGLGIKKYKQSKQPVSATGRTARSFSSSSSSEDEPLKTVAAKRINKNTTASTTTTNNNSNPSTPRVANNTNSNSNANTPRVSKYSSSSKHTNDNESNNDEHDKITPPNSASINGGSSSTPRMMTSTTDVKTKNEKHKQLRNLTQKWVSTAQKLKHESDKMVAEGKHNVAAIMMVESILAFLIGFDIEDRAELMTNGAIRANSWHAMIPFVARVTSNMTKATDGKLLIDICCLIRAVMGIRLSQSYQHSIKKITQNADSTDEQLESITGLTFKYTTCLDKAFSEFKKVSQELPIEKLKQEFPNTWNNRLSKQPEPDLTADKRCHPERDPYYYPFSIHSGIQDVAAFGYSAVFEWAAKHKVRYETNLTKLS